MSIELWVRMASQICNDVVIIMIYTYIFFFLIPNPYQLLLLNTGTTYWDSIILVGLVALLLWAVCESQVVCEYCGHISWQLQGLYLTQYYNYYNHNNHHHYYYYNYCWRNVKKLYCCYNNNPGFVSFTRSGLYTSWLLLISEKNKNN